MTVECERVGGINLAQGVCDTEVPEPVRRGAQEAIDAGINSYTRYDGIPELRAAIATKLRTYNGIDADPGRQITVSAGSTGAFYCACLALLEPGDEVVLLEPYYGYHLNTLLAVDAVPVFVSLKEPDWAFDAAELDRAITSRTKAIMINTPANPSGKVFSRRELEDIARIANANDLIVFTDEIYEYFLYDGRKHISPATLPELGARTVTISGFSKTFSITGWRIGYSVARADWAEAIGHMSDLVYVCAPAPLQAGVAQGLTQLGADFYAGLITDYAAKRDRICDALLRAGLAPSVPEGAYYVLADASKLPGIDSKEKAMHLLEYAGIAAVPGSAFFAGDAGERYLRFCYAKPDEQLDEACVRLDRYVR